MPADTQRNIRRARPDEARTISRLAIRSKAHWGYSQSEMEIFEKELTLGPRDIEARMTYVAVLPSEDGEEVIAFYTLLAHSAAVVQLEHLFVAPERMRNGHGQALFEHAIEIARRLGHARVVVQSDPNAEGFYIALGVPLLRRIPSSIPGREIPYFEIEL